MGHKKRLVWLGAGLVLALLLGPAGHLAADPPSKGEAATALRSARLYIQQKVLDLAIEQLKISIAGNPEVAEAHYLLGRLYGDMDRTADMLESFENLKASKDVKDEYLEVMGKYLEAHWARRFRAGKAALEGGEFEKAIDELKMAIRVDPTKSEAVKLLADAFVSNKQTDLGIDSLEKALAMSPALGTAEVYLGLSKAYAGIGNKPKQLEALGLALAKTSEVDGMMLISRQFEELGETDRQIQALEGAMALAPKNGEVALELTELCFAFGEGAKDSLKAAPYYDKALGTAREALTGGVPVADLADYAARIQFVRGQFLDAAGYFEKKWELGSATVSPLINAGICYENLNQHEKANASYQKATQADSSNSEAWRRLGDLRLKASDFEGALAAFTQVVNLSPGDNAALMGQAKIYALKGQDSFKKADYDAAVTAFRSFLKIQPTNGGVRDWLSRSYFNQGLDRYGKGDYDAALRAFEGYVEIKPDESRGFVQLAKTYGKKGLMKEAMEATRKAQALQKQGK